jgi:hypothetical protein
MAVRVQVPPRALFFWDESHKWNDHSVETNRIETQNIASLHLPYGYPAYVWSKGKFSVPQIAPIQSFHLTVLPSYRLIAL